mmetsp:Transcript_22254/g.42748  ORF Transcript_22254/g.42748 Transcript_22254/m.42748 type:complete len:279 (+) Transcript_22254:854-1690(+)
MLGLAQALQAPLHAPLQNLAGAPKFQCRFAQAAVSRILRALHPILHQQLMLRGHLQGCCHPPRKATLEKTSAETWGKRMARVLSQSHHQIETSLQLLAQMPAFRALHQTAILRLTACWLLLRKQPRQLPSQTHRRIQISCHPLEQQHAQPAHSQTRTHHQTQISLRPLELSLSLAALRVECQTTTLSRHQTANLQLLSGRMPSPVSYQSQHQTTNVSDRQRARPRRPWTRQSLQWTSMWKTEVQNRSHHQTPTSQELLHAHFRRQTSSPTARCPWGRQ